MTYKHHTTTLTHLPQEMSW